MYMTDRIIEDILNRSSSEMDIFLIKCKREVLESRTFQNPFDYLPRIIYPAAKQIDFFQREILKTDDIKVQDYLLSSPYTVSKTPQFVMNKENIAKRSTQGVVTTRLKPMIEKRWFYDFGVRAQQSGGIGSNSSDESVEIDMRPVSSVISSTDSLTNSSSSSATESNSEIISEGLMFIPIGPLETETDDDKDRIPAKQFRIDYFARFVQKTEPDNTDMKSFLYSTLLSYLYDTYFDIQSLVIIEIPIINIDSALSSDVSRVSSSRSEITRERLLEQPIRDIPIVYVLMHGGKQLIKNKKTKKLECRNMFRNPFDYLFRYISASPGAENFFNSHDINGKVFTTPFEDTLTVKGTTERIQQRFPRDTLDTDQNKFQMTILQDDNGNQYEKPIFVEAEKRNQFVVNYFNTFVCKKLYSLPETPTQDMTNWGIFVLNGRDNRENLLSNTKFIAFLNTSPAKTVEDVTTTTGETVKVVTKVTNSLIFDYFKFLGYDQIYFIDRACESSQHMTPEEQGKFFKVVKANDYKIKDLATRANKKRGLGFDKYREPIRSRVARRKDKEYYKRRGIKGLNALIDYNDNRAKTRKEGRLLSMISNNRGKFV